jgi:hypothetical protein
VEGGVLPGRGTPCSTFRVPIDFEEKARENGEAANQLVPSNEGPNDFEGYPNAAASRAYYAVYLAVAHCAQARHRPFDPGKEYYRHDSLPDDAARWGILDDDGHDMLEVLRSRRIKADYWGDHVSTLEAIQATEWAMQMLEKLLGARASRGSN